MKAQHHNSSTEVTFAHKDPVRAFTYLWARKAGLLTALEIFDDWQETAERIIANEMVQTEEGFTHGDWFIEMGNDVKKSEKNGDDRVCH